MNKKSIIIIGAGLAGLSTGCYAQMNGYESRIFEHHSKPGGVAAVWRRGEYLIDGGVHFLICHKPGTPIYDVYSEIGAVGPYEFEDVTTYLRFVDETGSQIIEFTRDLDRLERDLLRVSPEDEDEIRRFIKEIHWMKGSPLLTELGMSVTPPELRSRADSLREMWRMRGFMRYFTGKYAKSAADYAENFQSPFLKKVFRNLFSPDAPVWFVLKHEADVVVSAADGKSTIFELLDGKYLDEKTEKRYRTWKPYDPMVAVSLGVARTFEDDAPMTMFLMREPLQYGERLTNCLPLRIFNYGDVFAPEGKAVVQVMLETEWDYWHNLRQSRDDYYTEKLRLAQEIIGRLEVHYPGISSQVEMIDVATPYTSWRYTLNDRGSPMGWLLTEKTLMEQIPRRLPGLENFFMAGHWVLPGGGVPATIYTGRNVIQILCKRDGKKFKANPVI